MKINKIVLSFCVSVLTGCQLSMPVYAAGPYFYSYFAGEGASWDLNGSSVKPEGEYAHNGATASNSNDNFVSSNIRFPDSGTGSTPVTGHIGWIGVNQYVNLTITTPAAGWYTGTVAFKAFGSRTLYVTDYVNPVTDTQNPSGQPHYDNIPVNCQDGQTSYYTTITNNNLGLSATDFSIYLPAGQSTLKLDNGNGWAPDVYALIIQ
ncbi:hypothetical protein R75461_07869 [Paraburkholderia nemoris]|uniref:hypothetical protein n=1 Tax=Paraburkholderia nemoris TaxID=2793076 RepID=UPI00190C8E6F|nr:MULTISPECIES: hypothetical protein [Paraburkholderia]MBK3786903.1 hypothetical protein [Paraburkholderia aspalathi]CAE6858764.1 hypothetical protein R75461_07869 [Paraburkholderia nemoris]